MKYLWLGSETSQLVQSKNKIGLVYMYPSPVARRCTSIFRQADLDPQRTFAPEKIYTRLFVMLAYVTYTAWTVIRIFL